MRYCIHCGKGMEDSAVFCRHCGQPTDSGQPGAAPPPQYVQYVVKPVAPDGPSGAVAALSFFFPLIGFILYVVWQGSTPKKARSALKGALWGIAIPLIIFVVFFVFTFFSTLFLWGTFA